MEVHFGGGFARLIEGEDFSTLYVLGVSVEDAARAIPGLRAVRTGGRVVITHNGKPVVPVVGGNADRCFELASRVFNRGAWRRAKLLVRAGRLAAAGAFITGLASFFIPLTLLIGGAGLLVISSLILLALSLASLRGLARQVAYGSASETGVGGTEAEAEAEVEVEAVREEDYYAEAARLCCEKARRLLAEGREEEAMEYALRALNYASKVADVSIEAEASSPLQVVEAVTGVLSTCRRRARETIPKREVAPAEQLSVEDTLGGAATSGKSPEDIMELVEAYAGGRKAEEIDEKMNEKEKDRRRRSGRLEDYV